MLDGRTGERVKEDRHQRKERLAPPGECNHPGPLEAETQTSASIITLTFSSASAASSGKTKRPPLKSPRESSGASRAPLPNIPPQGLSCDGDNRAAGGEAPRSRRCLPGGPARPAPRSVCEAGAAACGTAAAWVANRRPAPSPAAPRGRHGNPPGLPRVSLLQLRTGRRGFRAGVCSAGETWPGTDPHQLDREKSCFQEA